MAADILKLLDQLQPSVRRGFLESVAEIKSEAQMMMLIKAIDLGDVEQALHVLSLREEMFAPLDDAIRHAYVEGGVAVLAGLPPVPDPFPGGAWLRALMREIRARKPGSPPSPPSSSPASSKNSGGWSR